METPLRAEVAALNERQEAELRELNRQLARTWEQSWSRAEHRANDNRLGREDDERARNTLHERDGPGGGRVRIRGYE